jgi:hypothetical protein
MLAILEPGGHKWLLSSVEGVNRGFNETEDSVFLKPSGGWSLYVDDVSLQTSRLDSREVWRWRPGFYAGTVRAELVRDGDLHGIEYFLDVSPDAAKVGQEAFNEMVRDIWAFDPLLVTGDQAAHTSIGSAGDRDEPAVRFMRLSRNAQDFARAMAQVRRDPHKGIRRARRSVPLHLVRRADTQTARAAATSLAALALADVEDVDNTLGRAASSLYDVPLSEPTLDTSANRAMSALVHKVGQAISNLSAELDRQLAQADGEEGRRELESRKTRRGQILDALSGEVRRCLQSEPLSAVTRQEISAAGLTAIAANPNYARAQQLISRMLRIGFEQGELVERSAMSPTWAIYEAWCFTRIAKLLQGRFPQWKWRRRNYADRRYGISGTLGDKHIDLRYQKQFSYSKELPSSGCWSISAQLIPDIVLIARTATAQSLMVLDAKYRVARHRVLEGMHSAHVYHDALRLGATPPAFSALLLPAMAESAGWLHDKAFQATHKVGAIVCSRSQFEVHLISEFLDGLFYST